MAKSLPLSTVICVGIRHSYDSFPHKLNYYSAPFFASAVTTFRSGRRRPCRVCSNGQLVHVDASLRGIFIRKFLFSYQSTACVKLRLLNCCRD